LFVGIVLYLLALIERFHGRRALR